MEESQRLPSPTKENRRQKKIPKKLKALKSKRAKRHKAKISSDADSSTNFYGILLKSFGATNRNFRDDSEKYKDEKAPNESNAGRCHLLSSDDEAVDFYDVEDSDTGEAATGVGDAEGLMEDARADGSVNGVGHSRYSPEEIEEVNLSESDLNLLDEEEPGEVEERNCGRFDASTVGHEASSMGYLSGGFAADNCQFIDYFDSFKSTLTNEDANLLKSRIRLVTNTVKGRGLEETDSNAVSFEELHYEKSLYLKSAKSSNKGVTTVLNPLDSAPSSNIESIFIHSDTNISIHPIEFASYKYPFKECPKFLSTVTTVHQADISVTCSPISNRDLNNCIYKLHSKISKSFRQQEPVVSSESPMPNIMKICEEDANRLELKEIAGSNTFFYYLNAYLDVLYTEANYVKARCIRRLCALHLVNHIFKVRDMLLKNNELLRKLVEKRNGFGQENTKDSVYSKVAVDAADAIADERLRDQGFTRPRILVLSPFRSTAKELIDFIIDACSETAKIIMNRKRYESEFGLDEAEKAALKSSFEKSKKPVDYAELFSGNDSDRFLIGIRLANKGVLLYTPFYSSDIIVASPLGLRLAIGAEGSEKRDYDFLSSIEILVCDRLDVIAMQNWQFLKDVFKVLNLTPKTFRDFDIRRIRNWNIDGDSVCYRQTVLLSDGSDAKFNALHNQSANFRGSVKLWKPSDGSILRSASKLTVQQLFQKVPCSDFSKSTEATLKFFKEHAIVKFICSLPRTILVLPTYVEYVRLWKLLKEQKLDFCSCHEYASNKMLSRSRQKFYNGECPLLITTSRFLFFRRYTLRGAENAVFWSPPACATLYKEVLEGLCKNRNGLSICYYTTFDVDHLEKLSGPTQAKALIDAAPFRVTKFE